ncbi:RHS repeat-associated core domain-containing protein [Pantoea sp. Tr-811]|uniref:RHS repeat-associated core domain-containing protein n=1 Tax=Pantoea sp. Tr-811 TaxID=2608361 RepID=UPI00142457AB|nr:RHS repeat-associated core domain-containing protein [Pantoea sp. Tr-811]NIF26620.1 RHS repeat-associated core domain-containing protein [Pantoea sp. Tr-811]
MIERYFYQDSNVVTVLQATVITTSLTHGRMTMAFLTGAVQQQRTTLLATDAQQSAVRYCTQSEQHSITFNAYGQAVGRPDLPAVFKGERPDTLSQHYILGMGYRSYNPSLMRFMSPDSDSPFARGGLNTYAFVMGDPINYGDPSGHGIGEFIRPHLKITRPYTTFGKTRRDNSRLKDIVVTSGREYGSKHDTMDVIFGHGDGWTVGGLTPKGLKEQLKLNKAALTDGPIHLISCRAGASTETHGNGFPTVAFGQQLSDIMGKPVTTYTEPVLFNLGLNPTSTLIELELIENGYLNAGPVTFYPEQYKKKRTGLLGRIVSKTRG